MAPGGLRSNNKEAAASPVLLAILSSLLASRERIALLLWRGDHAIIQKELHAGTRQGQLLLTDRQNPYKTMNITKEPWGRGKTLQVRFQHKAVHPSRPERNRRIRRPPFRDEPERRNANTVLEACSPPARCGGGGDAAAMRSRVLSTHCIAQHPPSAAFAPASACFGTIPPKISAIITVISSGGSPSYPRSSCAFVASAIAAACTGQKRDEKGQGTGERNARRRANFVAGKQAGAGVTPEATQGPTSGVLAALSRPPFEIVSASCVPWGQVGEVSPAPAETRPQRSPNTNAQPRLRAHGSQSSPILFHPRLWERESGARAPVSHPVVVHVPHSIGTDHHAGLLRRLHLHGDDLGLRDAAPRRLAVPDGARHRRGRAEPPAKEAQVRKSALLGREEKGVGGEGDAGGRDYSEQAASSGERTR